MNQELNVLYKFKTKQNKGGRVGGLVGGDHVLYNLQKRGWVLGGREGEGLGGCEPRYEGIVQLQTWGEGVASGDVN